MKDAKSVWVFIPWKREQGDGSSIKEWTAAWKARGVPPNQIIVGEPGKLSEIQNGATIYIQAHGFSNQVGEIGSAYNQSEIDSGKPHVQITPKDLATMLEKIKARDSLRIKVFACFSGFKFAGDLYDKLNKNYPGLKVYGYNGETMVPAAADQPKQVAVTPVADRPEIKEKMIQKDYETLMAWAEKIGNDGAAKNQTLHRANQQAVRVVYPLSADYDSEEEPVQEKRKRRSAFEVAESALIKKRK